jgi:hypothetical protein
MSKKYKNSLNFVFGVLIENRCIGRIPGPQLAGNKPCFVAYIIVSVFCSSEGWSTSDPNNLFFFCVCDLVPYITSGKFLVDVSLKLPFHISICSLVLGFHSDMYYIFLFCHSCPLESFFYVIYLGVERLCFGLFLHLYLPGY